MANDRDRSGSTANSPLEISKKVAGVLSEEGLLLAVLVLTEPTQLSLNWGAAFGLIGLLLVFWEHGTEDKLPLISGPYRFVRNPHELGLWLLSFGLAMAARSFPAILLVLIILPWIFYLDHRGVAGRPDSRLLRYRFHVPALIPTLLPFEKSSNSRFSWRRAIRVTQWSSRSKLICFAVIWAYLLISFNFKFPWWGGLIAAAVWILIKLFLLQRKSFSFSFRKNRQLSPKSL